MPAVAGQSLRLTVDWRPIGRGKGGHVVAMPTATIMTKAVTNSTQAFFFKKAIVGGPFAIGGGARGGQAGRESPCETRGILTVVDLQVDQNPPSQLKKNRKS